MSDTRPDALGHDREWLHGLLDQVLTEQLGATVSADGQPQLDELARLATARTLGDTAAGQRLIERLQALDWPASRILARAVSLRFDLTNLAEDRQRIRVLRRRERASHPSPRPESIAAALHRLADDGVSAEQVQTMLDRLTIEPVFTAHPTETKRQTGRGKIRRLAEAMDALDRDDLLPAERERLRAEVLAELTTLWQTDLLRWRRPTVLEEVRHGLGYAPVLWSVVPAFYRDLEQGLAEVWPEHRFRLPAVLTFGSWIGGDRDGNPMVTAGVTADTLRLQRQTALDLLEQILMTDRIGRFALAEDLSRDKLSLIPLLELWQTYLRDLILMCEECGLEPANLDRADHLDALAHRMSGDEALTALRATQNLLSVLNTNANTRLALEVMLLDYPGLRRA